MIWLLGGYIWLYVYRPFEIWPFLGSLQIERFYMLLMILTWIFYPGKRIILQCIDFAILLFAIAFFISYLISPYTHQLDIQLLAENFFKVIIFFILLITTVRDERELKILLLFFLASIGFYMLHSFWEYICGRYQYRMGVRRMMGVDQTYGDPNAFASTLVHALPLLIPLWIESNKWIFRLILCSYTILAILCILLTGSRTSFIALCILAAILILTLSRSKATIILSIFAGILLFIICYYVLLPHDLQSRYLTIIDADAGPINAQISAEGRTFGFSKGVELWQANPLLGLGPGSFPHASKSGMQPHNLYGQVLSEMGTLGACCFAFLIICFIFNTFYIRHQLAIYDHRDDLFLSQFAFAITLSIILLLLLGCGGHNLYRYNWIWLAAFSSISIHCLRLRLNTALLHYQYGSAIAHCCDYPDGSNSIYVSMIGYPNLRI